jgi:SAM-dependent methyltransferase
MTELRPYPDFLPATAAPALVPFYDRLGRLSGMPDQYWRLVAQAAIPPGGTVLDIGCGTGEVTLRAARAVPDATVTGLDPDTRILAIARRKAAGQRSTARFEHAYAQRLPAEDGTVDRVLSSLMLHHLPADGVDAALGEVYRVLRPGGSLHVLDIDGDRPGWSGPLRPLRAVTALTRHRGAHGHGHAGPQAVTRLLAAAGFSEVGVVGRGRSRMGGLTFYRATRTGASGPAAGSPRPPG